MTYLADRNPFKLTVAPNARKWDLARLQRLRCMYWMGVPTDKIAANLNAPSTSIVILKANAIGLYRPDWHIARVNKEARAKSRFRR